MSRDLETESMPPEDDRLGSWKEIAVFLGRDVRTVQRWEKQESLPVHRSPRLGVFASKSELAAWQRSRRIAPDTDNWLRHGEGSWKRWPLGLALGAMALLASLPLIGRGRQRSYVRPVPVSTGAPYVDRLLARSTSEGTRPRLIPVGLHPLAAVVTRDGEVYVANSADQTVSVINAGSGVVTQTLRVGERPIALTLSMDGRRLYVANGAGDVSVIDVTRKEVTTIRTGGPIADMVLDPRGEALYLAMREAGLKRVSTSTSAVVALPSSCPSALAVSPDGERLYVDSACDANGAIDVLDLRAGSKLASFGDRTGTGSGIWLAPQGHQLWLDAGDICAKPGGKTSDCLVARPALIRILRPADHSVLQSLAFPPVEAGLVQRVSFLPDGTRAVVGGRGLSVIDTSSFVTVEALTPLSAGSVALTADGSRAYVPVPDRNSVAVFDARPGCTRPSDLLAAWPGDGTPNAVRTSYHAVLRGGAAFAPGRVGQAFQLDGGGAFVEVEDLWHGTAGPFTAAAWVKVDANAVGDKQMSMIDKMTEASGGWRIVRQAGGRFTFCTSGKQLDACDVGSASAVTSTSLATPGTWFHVAGVKAAGAISIYVNGVLEAAHRIPPVIVRGSPTLRFGAAQGRDAHFHGLIDEVELYDRALDAEEIRALYRVCS